MWSQTTWAAPDTNAAMCAAVHEQAHKWYQEQLEAQSCGSGAAHAAVVAAAKDPQLKIFSWNPYKRNHGENLRQNTSKRVCHSW